METNPPAAQFAEPQQRRLAHFEAEQCVDIHCHCLPGLDDGPATVDEAVALCQALVNDGVTTVIATPHQLGRYDRRNPAPAVRAAVGALRAELLLRGIPLGVEPGGDVRLDERIAKLLRDDQVLTLADGKLHLLLELPHESYIDPQPLIRMLSPGGIRLIVSHPERHPEVCRRPERVLPWLQSGALLQLTAGSLLGEFGPAAEHAAWRWLDVAAAAFVASDAHDVTRRPPRMSLAIHAIERRLGTAAARRVCIENPLRVLQRRECPNFTWRAQPQQAPAQPQHPARPPRPGGAGGPPPPAPPPQPRRGAGFWR